MRLVEMPATGQEMAADAVRTADAAVAVARADAERAAPTVDLFRTPCSIPTRHHLSISLLSTLAARVTAAGGSAVADGGVVAADNESFPHLYRTPRSHISDDGRGHSDRCGCVHATADF